MDLFKVEGNLVVPTEHALMIPPYSEIWERDEDPLKLNAKRELGYIEFMCSYKKSNVYKGYSDQRRHDEVLKALYKEDIHTFVKDDLIVEGMELYEKLRVEASPTLQYYLSAKKGAEKMIQWLETFDMNTKNARTGLPLYKPREVTSALKDSYDVMKTLNTMEEKVNEQLFESTKTIKNREINPFEK